MKPEYWAICTALCWACGALLEKKGIKAGNLTPVMAASVRTAVSVLILAALSFPYWGDIKTAGSKSLVLIAVGGGLVAGGLGIVCLYSALKSGHLASVTTIAFCLTPVVGAFLGRVMLKEQLHSMQYLGIALCVVGAPLTIAST